MKMLVRMFPYFAIVAMAVGFLSYTVLQNQQATSEATRALCALRDGYLTQAAESKAYLKVHPQGAPSLGITASQIRVQIALNKARARSLNDVHCDANR